MNAELTKKLYDKYPAIFAIRESCMKWGFECGDGWFQLLDTLCEALTYTYGGVECASADVSWLRLKWPLPFFKYEPPTVIADQVKEKFGTLRFYYHLDMGPAFEDQAKKYPKTARSIITAYSSYINGIIHMAETMSGHTCELTGLLGVMHTAGGPGGWRKVLNVDFAKIDPWCVEHHYLPLEEK